VTGRPEIAFSGRSNVGKSSLINRLLNRRGIARTSSTPGRTQSLNFIDVNGSLWFVDLPGYGYAKVPDAVREKWKYLIEGYLAGSEALRLLVLIADARRKPGPDEELFARWLAMQGVPFAVVLTKADKVKRGRRQGSREEWKRFLDLDDVILFSAVTGEGKDRLWRAIDGSLAVKT